MSLLKKIKPKFWDHHDSASGIHPRLFSFRRKWKMMVLFSSVVALIPLIAMTWVDYRITRAAIEAEALERTGRLVSSSWRTVSFFLTERRNALEFIVKDNPLASLQKVERLKALLENLNRLIGGFVDLGIVNASGRIIAYTGPYHLNGANICRQACFTEVQNRGVYISDSVLVKGRHRHIVMGIKYRQLGGPYFILRATIDSKPVIELLDQLDVGQEGDAFIVNKSGNLVTPSRLYGQIHDKIPLKVPVYTAGVNVIENRTGTGQTLVIAYTYIPDTSFILMVVRPKDELLAPLRATRLKMLGFLGVSAVVILIAVVGMATYLVHRIHAADQKRIEALHQVEYTNKMVSLGRLAAGVAHEINNPLAIISEKSGLIKDIFTLRGDYARDEKLLALIDDVLAEVMRCGAVTQRLLNFARQGDITFQRVDLAEIISEMIAFLEKDAESRDIRIFIDIPEDIPELVSNRSNLQQILLNLFNNAFAAMNEGGILEVKVKRESEEYVSVTVTDNGCGIPQEDLGRVFEPFFCTKTNEGCTGLGLSITYNLAEELGGTIFVKSEEGQGTSFKVVLPLTSEKRESQKACPYYPIS